jgi:hypothetical protein
MVKKLIFFNTLIGLKTIELAIYSDWEGGYLS